MWKCEVWLSFYLQWCKPAMMGWKTDRKMVLGIYSCLMLGFQMRKTGTASAFVGSEWSLSLFVDSLLGRKRNAQAHSQLSSLKGARAGTVAPCTDGVCPDLGGDVRLAKKGCYHCPCRLSHWKYRSHLPFHTAVAIAVEMDLVSVLCLWAELYPKGERRSRWPCPSQIPTVGL